MMDQRNSLTVVAGGLEIGPLRPDEHDAALHVLVRGMHTNPISLAVTRNDPHRSADVLRHLFGAAIQYLGWERNMLVARTGEDGTIVGVCGMLTPGTCQSPPLQSARILPALLGLGPIALARTLIWVRAWGKRDLDIPHWHLGPVSVDPELQGRGIGTALMKAFCERMDIEGADAWLETDREINVRFYEKFGFEVVHQDNILSVPNWFMLRRAAPVSADAFPEMPGNPAGAGYSSPK